MRRVEKLVGRGGEKETDRSLERKIKGRDGIGVRKGVCKVLGRKGGGRNVGRKLLFVV